MDFCELQGLIFVTSISISRDYIIDGDIWSLSQLIWPEQVGAPARVGLVAPVDVVVPPGNTGLDPSQTSFFQVYLKLPFSCSMSALFLRTLLFSGIEHPNQDQQRYCGDHHPRGAH